MSSIPLPAANDNPQQLSLDIISLASKRATPYSTKNGRSGRPISGLQELVDVENGPEQSFIKASYSHLASPSPATVSHPLAADSYSPALLPINLNSELTLVPPLPADKGPIKLFVLSNQRFNESAADNHSFARPVLVVKGEDPEPNMESQKCVVGCDAQEESCCTPITAESISPCRSDLILWGNAMYCGSEARELTNYDAGLTFHNDADATMKKENVMNTLCNSIHLHPLREEANHIEGVTKADWYSVGTSPSAVESEVSLVFGEDNGKHDSSVGSTLSVRNDFSVAHGHPHQQEHWDDISIASSVPNSESLSQHLDPGEYASKQSVSMKPEATQKSTCYGKDKKEGNCRTIVKSSSALDIFSQGESMLSPADEAKIRAELELEIERDLEREIKAKITILNKRLEELHVVQSRRYSNQEEPEDASTVKEVIREETLPKQILSSMLKAAEDQLSKVSAQEREALKRPSSASGRKLIPLNNVGLDKEAHLGNIQTPVNNWKKASNLITHSKAPGSDHKNIRGAKVWPACTKTPKEERPIKTVVLRPKKFDWTETLRPDVPPSPPPRVSAKKVESGSLAAQISASTEDVPCGNVKRTLFAEEGLSTSPVKDLSTTKSKNDGSTVLPLFRKPRPSIFTSPATASSAGKTVIRKSLLSGSPSSVNRGPATRPATPETKTSITSSSLRGANQRPNSGVKPPCDPAITNESKLVKKCSTMVRASPQSTGKIERIARATKVMVWK